MRRRRLEIGWYRSVASVVVVVLSAGVVSAAEETIQGSPTMLRAPVASASNATAAVALARAQGSRVEVLDQRTETRMVFAEPGGTMTAELHSYPVRVRHSGAWVAADTTLMRRSDGSVGPKAAMVDLAFSAGGGTAPLVRYGRDGKWFALSWPGELPVPTLTGSTATYVEVLPGVDLVLRAEVDGYAQYLVVKTPAAARQAAVSRVRLVLRTDGLTVRPTAAGGLEANDIKGAVVFAAPPSHMWDASATPRRAKVPVELDGSALVLLPEEALLTGPETVFPVTIDPIWRTPGVQAWTSVLQGSGLSDTPFWNSSGHPPLAQSGKCYPDPECGSLVRARSYFQFDTGFLEGKDILEGNLAASVVHSPDCRTYGENEVYKAYQQIHPGTTWNNQPGGGFITRFAAPNVNSKWGCGGNKEISVNVVNTINHGWTTTYIIQAVNEADGMQWRKYDSRSVVLRVRYNTKPDVPVLLPTDPPTAPPCKWCAGVRYVGDAGIRLRARMSDPDGDRLKALWHIYVNGVVQPGIRGDERPSGEIHDVFLDLRAREGKAIDWHAKAEDGVAPGSNWPQGAGPFVVDRTPPATKPNVGALLYREDNRWHGGVDVPDSFTFDSAGVSDVNHFLYGWSDPPATKVDANALGGSATVILTPPGDGPRDLPVQSVDRAGHRSPTRVYHFYVRAGNGPLAQWSFEGNTNDAAFLGDRHGSLRGNAAYGTGAVGSALRLDGEHGTEMAAPNTVRTDASFSVSAWV
ncbi:MAG TPA: hypothetical protein DGG94_07075, partial [Micromonosporaceae bacterium]|nr:hypothetical protein [Micromonosporaceae bacterium]